ncbi:Uncharacterised protein [Mycobacteroides abscessus subsp. abscessus]|nr:hypothetical protein [Mycobacteroides abscessus]SLD21091.1 Uncharacterised protein [Mycobacteroides abscessus subsp. abscessus]SLG72711.1 Uncharacterised protein [Mycobacteroides abscessus subsp. abscessus]SLL24170.1 Uncharacterised protein [Mycobacteroides abscessus subsp. abscessus]
MSVRVHHHPVGVAAWLLGGNRGTETRRLVDSGTEVVHAEVEMKLLRVLLAGPLWLRIVLYALEIDIL